MSKITDINAALDPQFERVEMSNLDKVFERNRITKQGIDAMITNYLRLERKLAEAVEKERERCAKVCEEMANSKYLFERQVAHSCAEAIRKGE